MILPPLSFFCNKGFLCIFLIVVVPFRYSARNISDKCVRKEQVFETKVPEFNFCVALKHGNIVLVFFGNSKEQRLVLRLDDINTLLVFCSKNKNVATCFVTTLCNFFQVVSPVLIQVTLIFQYFLIKIIWLLIFSFLSDYL